MHKKLFIPGPTEVVPEILEAMSVPMIGHRMKEFSQLMEEVVPKVQKLFRTRNFIVVSTSSGTGLMEAAVRSCVKKKALHTVYGAFSKRWLDISKRNGKEVDVLEIEWGKGVEAEQIEERLKKGDIDTVFVTHNETSTGVMVDLKSIGEMMKNFPDVVLCVDAVSSLGGARLETDEWGVDVVVTSTQKCIALPPGLALASVSEKALERAKEVENRGYYFDFLVFKKYWDERRQTPTTPSISHIYALNRQLDRMLEEGIENRWKRHEEMAEFVRAWAREHFELFPDEKYLSVTLTTVKNTRGISVADLNKELAKRGAAISNGYGTLKEKTFRIAHMGDLTMDDMRWLLNEINEILGL